VILSLNNSFIYLGEEGEGYISIPIDSSKAPRPAEIKFGKDFFRKDIGIDKSTENIDFISSKLANLSNHFIVNIACGNAHSLLLTNSGILYSLYLQ
jgi:hypothetical protein